MQGSDNEDDIPPHLDYTETNLKQYSTEKLLERKKALDNLIQNSANDKEALRDYSKALHATKSELLARRRLHK